MGYRNDIAVRLAAHARRQGARSAADLAWTTDAQYRQFAQTDAALSYVIAAFTEEERDIAITYMVL